MLKKIILKVLIQFIILEGLLALHGKIVFYVDGVKVDANEYAEQHKASIDFHKIMDFIQQTLDRAPNRWVKKQ